MNTHNKGFTPDQKVRIIEAVCPVLMVMITTFDHVLVFGLV